MNRGRVPFRFALLVPTALTCCSPQANERSPDLQNIGNQDAEDSGEPEPVADDMTEPVAGQATAEPTQLGAVLLVTDISGQPVGGNANAAPSFSVVSDREELARVRTLIDDSSDALALDFEDYVGIVAYLGTQPVIWKYFTGVEAWDWGDRIEVEFVVGSPDAGPPEECGAAASVSYPYAFARVERRALPYDFSVREDVAQCEEPPPP